MKSSSLRLIDSGIKDPRAYRDSLVNDWSLPDEYTSKLGIYIQKETTPEAFFFHLKDGELKVKNKLFSVTWVNSPGTVREAKYVVVSLRYCNMLDRGYALVKTIKGDTAQFDRLEY